MNRKQQGINKHIENPHGRFFCWHDYTFLCHNTPDSVADFIEGKIYRVVCVKCGKNKAVKHLPIESIK